MRIGLVGRNDDKGLGNLTREFFRRLPVTKVLSRYGRAVKSGSTGIPADKLLRCDNPDEVAEEWVRDIDTLFVLEFARYDRLWSVARDRGIYSVLKVNHEFLPLIMNGGPDLCLCSSSVNLAAVPDNLSGVLISDPVDTEAITFRPRKIAWTFVHNAGTLGIHGANCTQEVLRAIPLVRNRDVRFIVRSQVRLPAHNRDERTTYQGSVPGVAELYGAGDIFLLPQKFRGTSLPIQEAMAAGMPVLTTDMPPFNEFCQFFIKPAEISRLSGLYLEREVPAYRVTPEAIASAIDLLAGRRIFAESMAARRYAETISWAALGSKLLRLLTPPRLL